MIWPCLQAAPHVIGRNGPRHPVSPSRNPTISLTSVRLPRSASPGHLVATLFSCEEDVHDSVLNKRSAIANLYLKCRTPTSSPHSHAATASTRHANPTVPYWLRAIVKTLRQRRRGSAPILRSLLPPASASRTASRLNFGFGPYPWPIERLFVPLFELSTFPGQVPLTSARPWALHRLLA
jgi:hypothetical protein